VAERNDSFVTLYSEMQEPTAFHPVEASPTLDFEHFFYAEFPRLVRTLYLATAGSSDAEEIAQEAFVRVYERWDSVSQLQSPSGYLFMTAFNVHRRWRRFARRLVLGVTDVATGNNGGVADAETHVDLMRALRQLSLQQREAVVLTAWLGLTAEAAAGVLGVEASSVRGRIHRARQTLRDHLGGEHV
jgi:RNA polymerase sigma factor (sigma-70 family)